VARQIKVENISQKYFNKEVEEEKHFRLGGSFLSGYVGKKPKFGFDGLGEFIFYRTYSRVTDDGSKETFLDTARRVVEGCYEIQRRHQRRLHLPWDYDKAQDSAQEMFERIWNFKFLPPGRGLWMMGTEFMWERGSAALNNCGFVSTYDQIESDPAEPFCFLMDMSMLGVGVGFDTKGANRIQIHKPASIDNIYTIADSREGWVDSLRRLIWSYTIKSDDGNVLFNYDEIRRAGEPINGFGGKASGPSILQSLHAFVREHLESRIGATLSSVDIVDIMNYIGACVVAGNVRRSSEIALGSPKDYEYCMMKSPLADLTSTEAEVFTEVVTKLEDEDIWRAEPIMFGEIAIGSDRFQKAIDIWNARNSHRWASNNSIFAEIGMDYTDFAERTGISGEPGYQWLDNIRDFGRMIDGRRPGIDSRACGTNPCFAGSMRILTQYGYERLEDLWLSQGSLEYDGLGSNPLEKYGEQVIVNDNGLAPATKVYRVGADIVYRVILTDGSWVDATRNHEFIVLDRARVKKKVEYSERRVKLGDLEVGMMIPLNQTTHATSANVLYDMAYAELAGWVIGDGSLSPQKDGQVRAKRACYDDDVSDVLPRLRGLMLEVYHTHTKSTNQQPVYAGWKREQKHFEHDEEHIGSTVLGRLLVADGVRSGDKHHIPSSIWCGSRETIAAFLKGFASADGGVQISDNGTISVRISQSNQQLLLDCRLLFSQLGIASTVQHRRKSSKQMMNDGKGGKKLYNRKEQWELIISGIKQVTKFLDYVGFIQQSKITKARQWLVGKTGSNNSDTGRYTKIKSVECLGEDTVYCLTEPKTNQVVVEGHKVGQCGEQSLESYELCCLVETFPNNHDSADEYMRTLKFAYLYGKTVTLLPTHNARTNQVMLRSRRIGLSQSGIVQAFERFGRRKVLKDFCDAGYNEIRRWDEIYSEWLCVPKSIKVTSVKPSGTVSLMVGATPGIHHPESCTYWRRVRISNDSVLIKILQDAGYHVELSVTDPKTMVATFAVKCNGVRPVGEVNIWEQVKNVVDYQRYWADNQVSCTIRFHEHEAKEIAKILASYEDSLKGLSFLPTENHDYPQAPYEACTPEEVVEYNNKVTEPDYSDYITEAVGSHYCDSDKCELPPPDQKKKVVVTVEDT